jgi:cell division protease FtsH
VPNYGKNIVIWLIVGVLLVALFNMFQGGLEHGGYTRVAFSDFLTKVDQGQIADVVMRPAPGRGSNITGHEGDGTSFFTQSPDYPNLIDKITAKNVKISVTTEDTKMD